MADEHLAALSSALPGEGRSWNWVPRHNAAAAHPTDFGLLAVPSSSSGSTAAAAQRLLEQLAALPFVWDVHVDKRMTAHLLWQPEGALKDVIVDVSGLNAAAAAAATVSSEPHDGERSETGIRSAQGQAAAAPLGDAAAFVHADPPQKEEAAGTVESVDKFDDQLGVQLDEEHAFDFSVPPRIGRRTTRFMMDSYSYEDESEEGTVSGMSGSEDVDLSKRLDASRQDDTVSRQDDTISRQDDTVSTAAAVRAAKQRDQARRRQLLYRKPHGVTGQLEADVLWRQGYTGKHVKVGVFDTGIRHDHPHIRYIKERSNWTSQNSLSDGLGHGSFVAGVIGGHDSTCPGFAPDVELHTFKVFTDDQISYTSWFLDAFNYALISHVNVINLSIGGPDYLDEPFVDKILEITSNGILMISAIGNDGPLYGTLNNPADQNDVIGVGGIDNQNNIAGFSSRGMSTWELPIGYGRIKPDVMAYAKDVQGSRMTGSGCRGLSGTSVASPVVCGAVCLLASTVPEEGRWQLLNPASMKQALVEGAVRLSNAHLYEQGSGRINLPRSMQILQHYKPRASVIPPQLDLTDCPYMWPFCKQPLYAGAMPVVFNATVLNGQGMTGTFEGPPVYKATNEAGRLLQLEFEHSKVLWPWSGFLAIYIYVSPRAANNSATAVGVVEFTIVSPPGPGESIAHRSTVQMPVRADIIPTPPRHKRLLWDQFHSIKYPPAYIPRDNLDVKHDVLDWHGDHLHTNFHGLYNHLKQPKHFPGERDDTYSSYFVEVLSSPITCFDASQYGALLLVDSEEEFYPEEIAKLRVDVEQHGLAVIVFGEWYNVESMVQMRFFDDNTRSWWTPATGGANVPALNDLLMPYGVAFGDAVMHGTFHVAGDKVQVLHGANIAKFPSGGFLHKATLNSVSGRGKPTSGTHGVLGLTPFGRGHVVAYGDANCLDSSHMSSNCYNMLNKILQRIHTGAAQGMLDALTKLDKDFLKPGFVPPVRRHDVNFTAVSFVLRHPLRCYNNAPCHHHRPSLLEGFGCRETAPVEKQLSFEELEHAAQAGRGAAAAAPPKQQQAGQRQGGQPGGGARGGQQDGKPPASGTSGRPPGSGKGHSAGSGGAGGVVVNHLAEVGAVGAGDVITKSGPSGGAGAAPMVADMTRAVIRKALPRVPDLHLGVGTMRLAVLICLAGLLALVGVWVCRYRKLRTLPSAVAAARNGARGRGSFLSGSRRSAEV